MELIFVLVLGTATPGGGFPIYGDAFAETVVLGAQASGITALGRTVFDALGIDIKPITLDKVADGPLMLQDGRADALWGAGVGWPAFTALAKSGARFIAPDAGQIATILR